MLRHSNLFQAKTMCLLPDSHTGTASHNLTALVLSRQQMVKSPGCEPLQFSGVLTAKAPASSAAMSAASSSAALGARSPRWPAMHDSSCAHQTALDCFTLSTCTRPCEDFDRFMHLKVTSKQSLMLHNSRGTHCGHHSHAQRGIHESASQRQALDMTLLSWQSILLQQGSTCAKGGTDQLEQEGEAHHERMGRQEILLAADHEGACRQILPAGRCLGYLLTAE